MALKLVMLVGLVVKSIELPSAFAMTNLFPHMVLDKVAYRSKLNPVHMVCLLISRSVKLGGTYAGFASAVKR